MFIKKETLKNTTDCRRNFDCIKNDKHIFCTVENCINDEVYFVKNSYNKYCPYRMSYGNSYLCHCPTRQEIFNKYGK